MAKPLQNQPLTQNSEEASLSGMEKVLDEPHMRDFVNIWESQKGRCGRSLKEIVSIEKTTENKISEGRKTRTDLILLHQETHNQQSLIQLIYNMASV